MKKTNALHLSLSLLAFISTVCVLNCSTHADIIYESATMGPAPQYSGYGVNEDQFLGSRFYIDKEVQVTAVGGHMAELFTGNLFAAIIRLNGPTDLPDGFPFYTPEVVVTKVFNPGYPSSDYRTSLPVALSPGWYALVFGTDQFGAFNGSGMMPYGGQENLPGASSILWDGSDWYHSYPYGERFVVEGVNITPSNTKITGSKFNDLDQNGTWDTDEPAMEGWEIYLDLNDNGVHESGEPNAITDPNGFYGFIDVAPGLYYIRETNKSGWQQTCPAGEEKYTVSLDPNEIFSKMNFGNCISSTCTIILEAIEDSYTKSTDPDGNYGASTSLTSGRYGSTVYRTFLKFDLSSIPPGRLITSAKLHLHNNLISYTPPLLAVYYISSDRWEEGTITWNNMPYKEGFLYADAQFPAGEITTWDVTFDTDEEYVKDGIYSLEIMSTDESLEQRAGFWSKDLGIPDMAPTLEIEYEPIFGGGTGEEDDPYLIYTAEQMNSIGLFPYRWHMHYKLMEDISLADYIYKGYNIIGTSSPTNHYGAGQFSGVFDGNGHTISDFSYSTYGDNYIALFGYVHNGIIKNLRVDWPNITIYVVDDLDYVGAIAGCLDGGAIIGCCVNGGTIEGTRYVGSVAGMIKGGYIANSNSSASVSGGSCIGGLFGIGGVFGGFSKVSNCYSVGAVTGDDYVGGFAGDTSDIIILNCYSTGAVAGSTNVGGFSGFNTSEFFADNVRNSFWDITTSGTAESAAGVGLETPVMEDLNIYLDAGWDFVGETANGGSDDWAMPTGGGYPISWYQLPEAPPLPSFAGGTGAPEDPYLIATVEQLNSIGHNPRLMDKSFQLNVDLDMSGTEFYRIAERPYAFTADFDGAGHTISNITIVSDTYCSYVGFLGSLEGTEASIRDLTLSDPNIYVPWGYGVGALVGKNEYAAIMNCHATDARVTGWWEVGGLAGINTWYGKISGSSMNGYVTENDAYSILSSPVGGLAGSNSYWAQIEESCARVEVFGNDCVGGLTGFNLIYGILTDCYASGAVTGTDRYVGGIIGRSAGTIAENCYSGCVVTGPVETEKTGGLVGSDSSSDYTACFWDSTINPSLPGVGNATVEGVIGESTENMYKSSTYTLEGWDFIDTWDICEDTNYPKLQRQEAVKGDFGCPDGVGMEDLFVFVDCWLASGLPVGPQPECTIADLDGDNEVNLPDFAVFGENWHWGI